MASKIPEIRIEPAAKGFIVHHDSMGSGPGSYKAPTKHIFTSHPAMIAHVAKVTMAKPASLKESMKSLAKAPPVSADSDLDGN
jgi:hypothetical protein